MKTLLTLILCFIGLQVFGLDASIPVPEADLTPVEPKAVLLRQPNSHAVTWKELRTFLLADDSNNRTYVKNLYDCKNFSLELFRRAQNTNIACYIATIGYVETPTGHAVVEFPTSDKGSVFVDFTPLLTDRGQVASKAVVMIAVGSPMIKVPLEQVPDDFDNQVGFFNKYRDLQQKIIEAEQKLQQYMDANKQNPAAQDKIQAAMEAIAAYNQQRSNYQPSEPFTVTSLQHW